MWEEGWENDKMISEIFYGGLGVMGVTTLIWVFMEYCRRNTISYLNQGYYFFEEYYGTEKKRWIPIPPSNIDASDLVHPRIINPALVDRDACYCCM